MATRRWWESAVVYEVYPRSFADGSGDGSGDLRGLLDRLPHLVDLGVDALWVTPWYTSPFVDGGYDVVDHRAIDPLLGTLDEAEEVVRVAHRTGLRVIADLVANHTSDRHPWFLDARSGDPAARRRYFFRDGRGPDGASPPNNWISAFGGPAWTRVEDGQWFLHLFAPEQPDLDWSNDEVVAEFHDVLRFWFDRGVDGFRIDAAPALAKGAGLPDADYGGVLQFRTPEWTGNPHWDVDRVHEVLRGFRRVADEYEERVLIAEAVVGSADRLGRYVRGDELHAAFNFPYLKSAWNPAALREVVESTRAVFEPLGVAATWAIESHDEPRVVTRYGRRTTASAHIADGQGEPVDLVRGARRARAAALLLLALPGSAYLYQGQELGLPDVDDIPPDRRRDPIFARSGGTVLGRDGARVPLPWSGEAPPFGFGPAGSVPWLPQPDEWAGRTVARQSADGASMLALHRSAIRMRRALVESAGAEFAWCPAPEGVVAFDRGAAFRCVVNLSGADLPVAGEILLASAATAGGVLPNDTAAWIRPPREGTPAV